MTKKLGAMILLSAVVFVGTSVPAEAQQSKQEIKAKRLFTKLKKLPNGSSPTGKVNGLAKKLVIFDVKKGKTYYRTATIKYTIAVGIKANVVSLQKFYDRIIKKAVNRGVIAQGFGNRLQRQINVIQERIQDPTPTPTATPIPTPTPYQSRFESMQDGVKAA